MKESYLLENYYIFIACIGLSGVEERSQIEEDHSFKYEMKKGYVYVYHNFFFAKREDPFRHGSQKDVENLKLFFDTQLGFTMRVKENLSAQEMMSNAKDLSERDFSKNDCLFFVILSHGKQEGILGVDDEPISLAAMADLFTADKCPTLKGKPKIFIVQACRGDKDDPGAVVPDARPGPAPRAALQTLPVESDFLVCYASPIGYSSYRDVQTGSWYIQELVRIFKEYSDKEHLMDLMLQVNYVVSRKSCDDGYKQMPSEECRLTKKCYFGKCPKRE